MLCLTKGRTRQFEPLVNITSIIRLKQNGQEKGPVEIPRIVRVAAVARSAGRPELRNLPIPQASNLPMRDSSLGVPVQVFEGLLGDDAGYGSVGGMALELVRLVVHGHEKGER